MTATVREIPALVNAASGTADEARTALSANDAFSVREVTPEHLENAVRDIARGGATRLLVAGGDGTIAMAAAVLIESRTELAILPGGTLNHFANDMGISVDPDKALALALTGACRDVDVAMVNGRVFLNTSSVGAYVQFVQVRDLLERRFGYRIASAIAALRSLVQLRLFTVELEANGRRQTYRTPLVFIGVGERELQLPTLGTRIPHGKRGLHVMVVRGRSRARVLALALNAVARGVKTEARTPALDSFLVDRCTIALNRRGSVAVDGELVTLDTPLQYHLHRDALRVVCP